MWRGKWFFPILVNIHSLGESTFLQFWLDIVLASMDLLHELTFFYCPLKLPPHHYCGCHFLFLRLLQTEALLIEACAFIFSSSIAAFFQAIPFEINRISGTCWELFRCMSQAVEGHKTSAGALKVPFEPLFEDIQWRGIYNLPLGNRVAKPPLLSTISSRISSLEG